LTDHEKEGKGREGRKREKGNVIRGYRLLRERSDLGLREAGLKKEGEGRCSAFGIEEREGEGGKETAHKDIANL